MRVNAVGHIVSHFDNLHVVEVILPEFFIADSEKIEEQTAQVLVCANLTRMNQDITSLERVELVIDLSPGRLLVP